MLLTYYNINTNLTYDSMYNPHANYDTITVDVPADTIHHRDYTCYINKLTQLKNKELNITEAERYYEFYIPKHSGNSFRKITAPCTELKLIQKELVDLLYNDAHVLLHNSAFAYIKNKSPKQMMQRHQQNNSKWFLKLDLKNFFDNCTIEIITNSIKNIYPLGQIECDLLIQTISKWCMHNGALPQGAVSSPLLSNLVMLPYDFKISNALKQFENKHFVYTRYADDIIISCRKKFNKNNVINLLTQLLNPFIINTEKTRFGSSAGRNWNLGLMLNKDNQLTIGYKRKQIFKAMLNNLFATYTNAPTQLSTSIIKHITGLYSYYVSIEPEYINYILHRLENKYNITLAELNKTYT